MKKLYLLFFTFLITSFSFGQEAIITGYMDSPCPSQAGRTVEIYVDGTIDFTDWDLVRQANGGGYTTNIDLTSLGEITDDFAYVTNNSTTLNDEFGITNNVLVSSAITDNGNDAFQITNSSTTVIDRFGEDGVDGSGTAWDHLDTYYYRVDGTPANNGTFVVTSFSYGAINLLDGEGICNTSSALSTLVPFGSYSTTASSTPTINAGGTVSGMFYYEGNPPSSEETFTISGINLTTDILVTAPTNFEVSLASGSGFASSVTVTPSSGTVAPTDIYVRLVSGLSANSYNGDVVLSSTGASNQTVSLNGLVSPADPLITISGSISSLEYALGSGPSNEDSFSVVGIFLTNDITVTAPADFEISLTSGSGFGTMVTIPQTGGTVTSTDIYVRLVSGLAENSYSGDVTASSTGATNKTISASGAVNPAATCVNVGDIIITEIMQNPNAVNDNLGEYFEIYNTTGATIDLIGWTISDEGSDSHTITSSVSIMGGTYAILGINSDSGTNGGLNVDYEYSGLTLSNSDDEIILTCSSTIIDQVNYDGGPNFPDPTGASMELSVSALNATDNDNSANWGVATSSYGDGDLGTPKTVNDFALSAKDYQIDGYTIYPNPTALGYINILSKSNSKIDITVFDILGKQVIKKAIINNKLDVSNLKAGIYVIKASQDAATSTKKLVIK